MPMTWSRKLLLWGRDLFWGTLGYKKRRMAIHYNCVYFVHTAFAKA